MIDVFHSVLTNGIGLNVKPIIIFQPAEGHGK